MNNNIDYSVAYDKKTLRRNAHFAASNIMTKGFLIGTLIFTGFQTLAMLTGGLELSSFVFSAALFIFSQIAIYIFVYKVSRKIIIKQTLAEHRHKLIKDFLFSDDLRKNHVDIQAEVKQLEEKLS